MPNRIRKFKTIRIKKQKCKKDRRVQVLLREILALYLLPPGVIEDEFERVSRGCTGPLKEFVDYVNSTWITSTTWPPYRWSGYGKMVRTTNEVESWHRRLKAFLNDRTNVNMYELIEFLIDETELIPMMVTLFRLNKIKRNQ